jgi:hypothetical protein
VRCSGSAFLYLRKPSHAPTHNVAEAGIALRIGRCAGLDHGGSRDRVRLESPGRRANQTGRLADGLQSLPTAQLIGSLAPAEYAIKRIETRTLNTAKVQL